MHRFHSVRAAQPHNTGNQSESPNTNKARHQRRGHSLHAAFPFPDTAANKTISPNKDRCFKEYLSSESIWESEVKLGSIGQQLQQNLRQAILCRTNSYFCTQQSTTPRSYPQHSFAPNSSKHHLALSARTEFKSNTLSLLHQTISKHDLFYVQQEVLQLHTIRLPILPKKQDHRKRPSRTHQRTISPTPPRVILQPTEPKPITQILPMKQQKPFIRGWDTVQLPEA